MTLDDLLNPGNISREQIAIMRANCDRSLLYFTRLFYLATERKKFIYNWHHAELCQHFQDFSEYKVELLNINIPPRCSKTLIMMMCICRSAGMRHSSNSLYITASDNLRKKTTTDIRRILTHPLFKRMYGLELMKDQNSKDVIGFVGGGSLTTASIFGQITGFGAGEMTERPSYINEDGTIEFLKDKSSFEISGKFEGGIYIDDANKIKDSAAQNANNDAVKDVTFNTVFSRRNSSDTPLANIQQRAGETDLTDALMKHYHYGTEKHNPLARFVIMPVISPDGKLLWEWRYPLKAVQELKESPLTAHVFETQYMQNPVPSTDVVFPSNKLNYFTMDELNTHNIEFRCGAIDVADEGADSFSFPSGVLIGNNFFVTDWIFTKENTEYTLPMTAEVIKRNKLDVTLIETNNHGAIFLKNLTKLTRAYIGGINNSANKHGRIIAEAQTVRLNFFFRTDVAADSEYAKAMTELTRYAKEKSKHDDAPDSIALLSSMLRSQYPDRFY